MVTENNTVHFMGECHERVCDNDTKEVKKSQTAQEHAARQVSTQKGTKAAKARGRKVLCDVYSVMRCCLILLSE